MCTKTNAVAQKRKALSQVTMTSIRQLCPVRNHECNPPENEMLLVLLKSREREASRSAAMNFRLDAAMPMLDQHNNIFFSFLLSNNEVRRVCSPCPGAHLQAGAADMRFLG
jgi:hypothetical protein